jgi:hypothetical protein
MAFLTQNAAILCQKLIVTLVFKKTAFCFAEKVAQIVENTNGS